MQKEQKKFLNTLNIALSPNPEGVLKILDQFPLPEKAYNISEESLKNLGFRKETISNFLKRRERINVEKEWQKLKKENIKVIAKDENEYPPLLKEIAKPPSLLYIKGELLLKEKYFASVGTRWPSDYGKMVTTEIVGDIAEAGFTIVSGMARGIDTLSHKAALEKNKRTVAVFGTGLDIIFPPENKKIEKEIEKNGAIISEFPLQTPPFKHNFSLRNRIIAGVSIGTLIIEAKEKSGALITANLALNEGREVFAIPGSIYSKTSEGCNNLIKQGAHPVTSANDILSVFELEKVLKAEKEITGKTKEEKIILETIKDNPKSIDEIIKETKIEAGTVNSTLIFLEIEKKVKRSGGKYYINN